MFKKLLAVLALFYAAVSFAAVDVNTATAADLDSVKGIGPGLSGRILDERKKGSFKDWSDLIARVKGVGDKSAARFSAEGMTVNGAAYAGAAAKAAKEPKAKTQARAADKAPAKP
ncbi:ComEA family DNA-binding protein [Ottowia sp.]|uniref:ComEA family DNA-binding protein n=1 Tax=Ottowia sp. TaxID=1898956 RepID=UPI0039E6EE11